jgi:hypothetical protein
VDEADPRSAAKPDGRGDAGLTIDANHAAQRGGNKKDISTSLEDKGESTPKPSSKKRALTTSKLEEMASPEGDNDDEDAPDATSETPRYQSKRAAAELANSRISNKNAPTKDEQLETSMSIGSPREKSISKPGSKKKAPVVAPPEFVVPERQWACCDTCGKWRQLPYTVNIDSLPEQWFCRMNRWDGKHNTCAAIEETGSEPIEPEILAHEAKWEVAQAAKVAKPAAGRKPGRKSLGGHASDSDDEANHKRKSPRAGVPMPVPAPVPAASLLVQVDWVECNKCKKWRKVPSDIAPSLPDVWTCTMNNWNPITNKCIVKEETEESPFFPIIGLGSEIQPIPLPPKPKGSAGRRAFAPAAVTVTPGVPVKKVTQWVQCERRNCKKWRKVPAHISMKSLPEKWYCEMNSWDLDRASCDGPEDSDSEAEGQGVKNPTRNQLILANSKGPGSLSYRRIIFGADGRLRPVYSEKSRNGYGLFSFTETNKSADNDDYMEPTRRIGYWWSGAFDEAGARYFTASKREPAGSKKKDTSNDKIGNVEGDDDEDTSKASVSSTHLITTARKLAGWTAMPPAVKGKSAMRREEILHDMSILQRHYLECAVVRSCLMTAKERSMTLAALVSTIKNASFHDEAQEACRWTLDETSIRVTIRRMETVSEAEVTYSVKGDVTVHMLRPQAGRVDSLAGEVWGRTGLPLKFRKSKPAVPHPVRPFNPEEGANGADADAIDTDDADGSMEVAQN